MLAGNIIGILVNEDHNPISETISALAIGPYAWIMDSSLCLFAAALLACALGLYRWHLDGAKWTAATGLLALLGIDVIVIALYNQYAGGQSTGAQVHFFAVCALGILVGLIAFLLVSGLREIAPSWVRFSFWFGLAWVILAPLFSLVPTGWEGAYERFLGLLLISWIAALSWLLLQRRRRILPAAERRVTAGSARTAGTRLPTRLRVLTLCGRCATGYARERARLSFKQVL